MKSKIKWDDEINQWIYKLNKIIIELGIWTLSRSTNQPKSTEKVAPGYPNFISRYNHQIFEKPIEASNKDGVSFVFWIK